MPVSIMKNELLVSLSRSIYLLFSPSFFGSVFLNSNSVLLHRRVCADYEGETINRDSKTRPTVNFLFFALRLRPRSLVNSLDYTSPSCLCDRHRCTAERTPVKSRSAAPIAASSFRSCAITSTIAACTRARGSSPPLVRNAASTSTTAATWARTWRSIGTARSTAARNVGRASISEWPTTCMCAYTRAWSRTSAISAERRSRGRCCLSSTWGPILASGRTSARSARKRSPTAPTWPCTLDCTPVWNPINAPCARKLSPRSITWRPISTTIPAPSRTPALIAAADSRRAAIWGLTSKSASSTILPGWRRSPAMKLAPIAPTLRATLRRRWSWRRPTPIRSPVSWHRSRRTLLR